MSRYINAEYNLHDLPNYYDFSDEGLLEITEALRSIPTADVRENIKGEWIEVIDIGFHGWRCNLCGEDSYRKSNYCPNCGADMRGGKNERE